MHKELAIEKLPFLRAEIVFDFVKNFQLESIVNDEYLNALA